METQGELHPFVNYEWLLTNGMGAFASSTVVGCNTRRYHGMLVAATLPPLGRMMTLNRVGELIYIGAAREVHELSVNQFGQTLHPRGERYLRRFEFDRTATWEYLVDGVRVRKELQLVWKRNLIGVRYTLESDKPRNIELHLLPFVSLRDFHGLMRKSGQYETDIKTWNMTVGREGHQLYLRTDAGQFVRRDDWWYGHSYPIETERGLDDTEDLYVPGAIIHTLPAGSGVVTIWAGTEPGGLDECEWETELARRPAQATQVMHLGTSDAADSPSPAAATPTVQRLLRAAADFVVDRRQPDGAPGTTVLAGYPWFADWGRDTMIALPGLLLVPGRFAEARQVLTLFAKHVSEGMIPNRFDDYTNEPHYNTVDASLWFVHAAFEYLRYSGDRPTFDSVLRSACDSIIDGYRRGTRFSIKMDESDGLIAAGDANTQLTWMDAKCGNIAFTPRHGKAVEINALWYNALVLLGHMSLAEQVKSSFVKAFWQNPFRGLFDVVNGSHRDGSIRPNQIFAVSLPHSPLARDQQLAVVEVVRRELLTPYGPRTLSKSDSGYKGHLRGGPMERDCAYHNGTVWPWLIGPFLEAYVKSHEWSPDAVRQARVWLQPIIDNLNQACIGQISECFEGDEPHRAVGAPAQAWSVAEVLRMAVALGM